MHELILSLYTPRTEYLIGYQSDFISFSLKDKKNSAKLFYQFVDHSILVETASELKQHLHKSIGIRLESPIPNFADAVLQFSIALKAMDNIILHKSTGRPDNSRQKNPITGNYHDTSNNIIEAPDNLINCYFRFKGKNNKITIAPGIKPLKNIYIEFLGDNGSCEIGDSPRLSGTIRIGYASAVIIEDGVTSTNSIYLTCAENTKVFIGQDCMFATGNQIRTDDAHAIYDLHTGKRVNHSKSIHIGKHVWVGYNAVILGGSHIGNGSVVGMNSLVKKQYPNNCVIAGNPAKVIRKDIFWERPNVLHQEHEIGFSETEINTKPYCRLTENL